MSCHVTAEANPNCFTVLYASGSFLQVIGDTDGADKSTVSRAVHNVSELLAAKKNHFIKWPTNPAELNQA